MIDLTSPLRYPGSKFILAQYFESTINENLLTGCHFYEPYAGGASTSLYLLGQGTIARASLVERDPLIYAFWKCVQGQPEALCERIRTLKITMATWKRFQQFLTPNALREYDLLDLGVAGLFLNRTNFSGILSAKPIGGMSQTSEYKIDCRFNKTRIIDAIMKIAPFRKRFSVYWGDAVKFLRSRQRKIAAEHSLVYIDPPYLQQGPRLYRYFYGDKQHRELAEFLNPSPFRWIVSYDNHPFIHGLFKDQQILPIRLNYAVKKSRKADELLIANIPLNEPSYYYSERRARTQERRDGEVNQRRLKICAG
jgi:DNA adenine methylase